MIMKNTPNETLQALKENALFCRNTLAQDISNVYYVVNGIKIKATDLL